MAALVCKRHDTAGLDPRSRHRRRDQRQTMQPGVSGVLPGHPTAALIGPNLAKKILAGKALGRSHRHRERDRGHNAAGDLPAWPATRLRQRRRDRLRARRRAQERRGDRGRGGRKGWAWGTTPGSLSSPVTWPSSPGSARPWEAMRPRPARAGAADLPHHPSGAPGEITARDAYSGLRHSPTATESGPW